MNLKRFIIVPVVFALGWLSFGIGSDLSKWSGRFSYSKNVFKLGPTQSGDRFYYMVTCTGKCKGVRASVSDPSGNPDLFVEGGKLPSFGLQYGCPECFCKADGPRRHNECNLEDLKFSSFGITVHSYTYNVGTTLKIEGSNVDNIEQIRIHSESWDYVTGGEKYTFMVTCNGWCKRVSVWVRGSSPRKVQGGLVTMNDQIPDLYLAKRFSDLYLTGRVCRKCFCQPRGYDVANSCELDSLRQNSFVVSVLPDRDLKGVELSVVGLNVERMVSAQEF